MSVEQGFDAPVSSPIPDARRLQSILDSLLEGCAIFDRDWKCFYANETAARLIGGPRDSLVGLSIMEAFPRIETTKVIQLLRRCMEEAAPARVEAELPLRSGPPQWFDLSCSPVPEGVLLLLCDITERKVGEESLRANEARFRSLVEQAGEAMFVHDFSGRFVEVNPQACRSLGYSRDELLSMTVMDVEQDFDLPAAQREWAKIELERPFTLYGHQRRKDGTTFPVEVRFGRFDSGGQRFFLGMARDITDRREAELRQKHLTEVLRAIRSVNQLIVHEKDPKALLQEACDLLTATRGYESAWVATRDSGGCLHAVAEARLSDTEAFRLMQAGMDRGMVPPCCSQAAARPDGIVLHDLSTDCAGCILAKGYQGMAALVAALRASGRDYGVLVAALPLALARDEEEQSLFREITEDIGFALQSIESERERLRAVEALSKSEGRLKAALSSMTDAVSLADPQGTFTDFNEAFATFHRFRGKQECARTLAEYPGFLDVFLPNGEPAPLDQWAVPRALRGETVANAEYRLRRKDTGETWIGSYSFAPIRDRSGAIVGCVVVGRDITERKRAEEALRESEERFAKTFAASPVGINIFGLQDGRSRDVNPSFLKIVGYTREEVVGRTAAEMNLFVDPQMRAGWIQDLQAGLPVVNQPARIRRKSGEIRHILASLEVIEVRGDRMGLVIAADITDREEAEQAHAGLQAQLLQAQKMESVGRLAGGVAHDFNNILTVQRGYCEILKKGLKEDDPISKGLAQIDRCAERAASLTRQLLAFSRRQTLQPKVIEMNVLVRDLDRMLRRLIGEDVELSTVLSRTPTMVMADPGQIEQVIINLAVNARDAMPNGGTLTIEVARVELDETYAASHVEVIPGRYVMLAVSDTGTGMDADTQRRLFEPFFTTKGEGKGTGLGLSTVYGIIRQSGGSIWVYSELGKGSTFKVYLPRIEAEAAGAAETEPVTVRGGGEVVLVVEDEAPLRDLAKLVIENLGYRVVATANGGEALILVEEQGLKPDLVLTDVVMPGMNGRALVDRLRRTLPELKVVFMSGYTDDAVVQHGVLDSTLAFLQKPFTVSALAARLRSALKES